VVRVQVGCAVIRSQHNLIYFLDYDPEFATHEEIIERLKSDRAGKAEIEAARQRCPDKTADWLAANMVAWWSQTITEGKNPWGRYFERKEIKRKYAYKPKSTT